MDKNQRGLIIVVSVAVLTGLAVVIFSLHSCHHRAATATRRERTGSVPAAAATSTPANPLAALRAQRAILVAQQGKLTSDMRAAEQGIKYFSGKEHGLIAQCRQAKVACQVTTYDENKIRSCSALSLPLRNLNKAVRDRLQLQKNATLLKDMLTKIEYQIHSLDIDINMLLANGGNPQQMQAEIEKFMKDFAVPAEDLSGIPDESQPAFSLRDTWNLLAEKKP